MKKLFCRRIVERSMGGWKWGYPRGHRREIVGYEARFSADGTLRWWSIGPISSCFTAKNHDYLLAHYSPIGYGSVHRQIVLDTSLYAGVPTLPIS